MPNHSAQEQLPYRLHPELVRSAVALCLRGQTVTIEIAWLAPLVKTVDRLGWGRPGNAYDNTPMKGFFATLQEGLIHHRHDRTRQETQANIFEHIEVFDTRRRRHSALDYHSPVDYEIGNGPLQLSVCSHGITPDSIQLQCLIDYHANHPICSLTRQEPASPVAMLLDAGGGSQPTSMIKRI